MSDRIGSKHPVTGRYAPVNEGSWTAATWPLGALTGDDGSCRFAVYSGTAEALVLELYDEAIGSDAARDYFMAKGPDGIFRAHVSGVGAGALYGFRAWGPNWRFDPGWRRGNSGTGFVADVDGAGNRFNPNKLLFDPYARELSHDRVTPGILALGDDAGMYGTGGRNVSHAQIYGGTLAGGVPLDRRNVDTGKRAPKSVVVSDTTSFGAKPKLAAEDSIIYEAHVRGLTAHPSASRLSKILARVPGFGSVPDVPKSQRGTYAGAGLMAPYLQALGYTAIEFLPVHESANDDNPDDRPGGNFWGYMTYGYFAPDRRFSSDRSAGGPTREFKSMVRAFHECGIEVYLDVVFNHTGEGGIWDSTRMSAEILSFRGLDNAAYYALVPGDPTSYWESTGCGNNLNAGSGPVRNLILDSLTYWLDEMGVDGYRFDLAPALGRVQARSFGFDPRADILVSIADLAQSRDAEVIAEAWDTAGGGYQVGNFPDRWAEWNGRYRDTVRRFMKGSTDGPISPADALHGDWLHFQDQGGPERSVNFITAHDGFTLADLVSYNARRNDGPWPFGPSDGGASENESWDSAWVPPASGCPDVEAFRRQRIRNFLAFQFLSRGVPMTVYGDEFGRTQNGNNNPYNLDSVATWNNYDMIATDAPQRVPTGFPGAPYHDNLGVDSKPDGIDTLFLFARSMIRLRASSRALRQGNYDMGMAYSKPDGHADYESREDIAFMLRIDGSAVGDRDYLVLVNMSYDERRFLLGVPDRGTVWKRLADTAYWAESVSDNAWPVEAAATIEGDYVVKACSIVLLASF
ncbi:MAG: isoamylase [Spirochaetes bacterium]|nr:isoamylase [Spirochaetota bacterium]